MRTAEEYRPRSEDYLRESRQALTSDAASHLRHLAEVYRRLASEAEDVSNTGALNPPLHESGVRPDSCSEGCEHPP